MEYYIYTTIKFSYSSSWFFDKIFSKTPGQVFEINFPVLFESKITNSIHYSLFIFVRACWRQNAGPLFLKFYLVKCSFYICYFLCMGPLFRRSFL